MSEWDTKRREGVEQLFAEQAGMLLGALDRAGMPPHKQALLLGAARLLVLRRLPAEERRDLIETDRMILEEVFLETDGGVDIRESWQCAECGRVVVSVGRPKGDSKICGACVVMPGWMHDPDIANMIDPEGRRT